MNILEEMKRKSKWIWNNAADAVNSYVTFVKCFDLQHCDSDAQLAICADSDYAVYLNDRFVSCGQFNTLPGQSSVDIFEISSFLRRGNNVLTVIVYYKGESTSTYAAGKPGLCYLIQGDEGAICSDRSTLSAVLASYSSGSAVHKTTLQLGFGYCCDLRKPSEKLSASDEFSIDTKWIVRPVQKTVIGKKPFCGKLLAQGYLYRKDNGTTPAQQMQNDYLSFQKPDYVFDRDGNVIMEHVPEQNGVYLVMDFGEEKCGYFTMNIETSAGTVCDVGYGEHLDDLRVRTSVGGRNFADRIIAKDGQNNFTYYFRRIAGRYLQLHFSSFKHLRIKTLGIFEAQYPLIRKDAFHSSDSLINEIYRVGVRTLSLCVHDHYEDCPWREQALYSFDSRNQALCAYYVFQHHEFVRASIQLLGDSLGEDGFEAICAPGHNHTKIPSFTFMWIVEAKEYLEYTKEDDFAPYVYGITQKILKAALSRTRDGVAVPPQGETYWNFYEWSDGYEGDNQNTGDGNQYDGMYLMFLYLALNCGEWIAQRYGYGGEYGREAEKVKKQINSLFWNEEKRLYSSYKRGDDFLHYGEFMQALALYNGIAVDPQALKEALTAGMKNGITLSASIFKYEGLIKHDPSLIQFVTDDIKTKWGSMLQAGCTSFWETLKGADDFQGAGSLCHGWSAIPVYLLHKYADPAKPL